MGIRLILDRRRWLGICLLGVCCVAGLSTQTFAQHNYVMRDGRMIPLVKSTTEWGVLLQDPISNQDAMIRISAQQFGTIRNFNDNPDSALKIIQVQGTTVASQDLVRLDPAIVEAFPVFRFMGIDQAIVTTGTILTKINVNITPEKRAIIWADYGYIEEHQVQGQPGVYRIKPADPDADEVVDAERIARDPRTQWAQPNFYRPYSRMQSSPSDSFFTSQWHLQNIEAQQAWLVADGQDVLMGMFDDACDVDHEDLIEGYIGIGHDPSLPSTNSGNEDPRPKQPDNRHGTSVMGLAVARANDIGVRGVAYQSRFTVSRGLLSAISDEEVAGTYTFARQQDVDVHINSWGFVGGIPNPAVVQDAIELAFREGRNKGDLDDDDEDDPLGMVIVFATGNGGFDGEGDENFQGFELSTMPQVIGVGASDRSDHITGFSNFGEHQNVLAPGVEIATTDNEDTVIADQGYNFGGFNLGAGQADLDPAGSYTKFFSGTSAACPIVAGVASLILSQNPLLTASDVRLIIDHTADQVNRNAANYHGITSHSLLYGYGRVNAAAAVGEANNTLAFSNRTWPDRPADVTINPSQIRWRQNHGTDDSGFLIVQSNNPFNFIPADRGCYSRDQLGCGSAQLASLPSGVSILDVGCELTCDSGEEPKCEIGANQCVPITPNSGKQYFAIYARNSTGLYSFGVALDTDGNIQGSGEIIVNAGDNGGFIPPGGGVNGPQVGPAVTIQASPLNGLSPVTVNFRGNAVSEQPIDDSKTFWDFDIAVDSDSNGTKDDDVNQTSRTTEHQYIVPPGESRLFIARLTMVDADGNVGTEEVSIQVDGVAVANGSGSEEGAFRVVVGTPTNPNADLSEGNSPFEVMLNLDADVIPGTLQSVSWDLGDGKIANTLSVPHTYRNNTNIALRLPITATVTTTIAGGATVSAVTTKLITVFPGDNDVEVGRPHLPGTGAQGVGGVASPCGAIGMIPLLSMVFSLMFMRRRWM